MIDTKLMKMIEVPEGECILWVKCKNEPSEIERIRFRKLINKKYPKMSVMFTRPEYELELVPVEDLDRVIKILQKKRDEAVKNN